MAAVKNESSATSTVLFLNVKGEPMRFFIRPGPTKVQLQPLISNGGGVLCRTQEPNAILLADPGDITAVVQGASHFYISTQYVYDCVAQNQQLDLESYRFGNSQPGRTRAASRKQFATGRMGYSLEDDTAIVNFIAKHRKEAKGNRVWQQMERQGVTAHSWQSMKDRFLKHLQHRLESKSPEKKQKVSPMKESSASEDNISQSTLKGKKAAPSDSDATQISPEPETREQPDLQASPGKINDLQDLVAEETQTDEVRKETDVDDSTAEKEQTSDKKLPEVLPKRARMDTDSPAEGTSSGPNDQISLPREKQNNQEPSAVSGTRFGILERAAREFEDSQTIDEIQQDQPPSQTSITSDTDDSQIKAARQRALTEQEVNPEHSHVTEEPPPSSQNHSSTPGPEVDDADDGASPSSAALPTTSNAHMFLFQQESQEEFSQPSEKDLPSRSLLETQQHVVKLMQESKKDLVEVMKALLKASGDVTLARSYLLEGYDPGVHGPIWTRHDDEMLRSADSLQFKRLNGKYGADGVSKRAAFLKEDL